MPGMGVIIGSGQNVPVVDNPVERSGGGQAGPYAGRAGVDGIVQADSGLMSLIGLEGVEPCKVQAPVLTEQALQVEHEVQVLQFLRRQQARVLEHPHRIHHPLRDPDDPAVTLFNHDFLPGVDTRRINSVDMHQ